MVQSEKYESEESSDVGPEKVGEVIVLLFWKSSYCDLLTAWWSGHLFSAWVEEYYQPDESKIWSWKNFANPGKMEEICKNKKNLSAIHCK